MDKMGDVRWQPLYSLLLYVFMYCVCRSRRFQSHICLVNRFFLLFNLSNFYCLAQLLNVIVLTVFIKKWCTHFRSAFFHLPTCPWVTYLEKTALLFSIRCASLVFCLFDDRFNPVKGGQISFK